MTAFIACALARPCAGAGGGGDSIERLGMCFEPAKPTLSLSYDVDYRLLFLRIARLARATVQSTEGTWRNQVSGEALPAYLIRFQFDTLDEAESRERGRISIHRTILIALRRDDLDTIVYAKLADEFLNPLFVARQETRYFELYDFQPGTLRFRRRDFLTGAVQTNLAGGFDPSRQGREVGTTLRTLADVYAGRRAALTFRDAFTIYVNISGVATPFAMTTAREDLKLDFVDGPLPALKADLLPTPEAGNRGKPVALWSVPFGQIARQVDARRFEAAIPDAPDWGMVPLIADYALAIGYVRGRLNGIDVLPVSAR